MTLEEIGFASKIIMGLVKTKNFQLTNVGLTGGEPTLHPMFYEIVRGLEAVKLHLFTNGSVKLDPDKLSSEKPFHSIKITTERNHLNQKPLKKLELTNLMQFTPQLELYRQKWGAIRDKGRGTQLVKEGGYKKVEHTACLYETFAQTHDAISLNFAPGHIRFCSENSVENLDGPNFTTYDEKYLKDPTLLVSEWWAFRAMHAGERCANHCNNYIET